MAKLNDIQVYDRLHAAESALGQQGGATPAGDTALQTARRTMAILQMALVKTMEEPPPDPLPPPPY